MAKVSEKQRTESRQVLRDLFDAQDKPTAYTIIRHVSASGMTRDISVKVIDGDGRLRDVSWHVAKVLGWTLRDVSGNWAVRVTGCGMDMGFYLVYTLSHVLYDGDTDRPGYFVSQEWA